MSWQSKLEPELFKNISGAQAGARAVFEKVCGAGVSVILFFGPEAWAVPKLTNQQTDKQAHREVSLAKRAGWFLFTNSSAS